MSEDLCAAYAVARRERELGVLRVTGVHVAGPAWVHAEVSFAGGPQRSFDRLSRGTASIREPHYVIGK